MAPYTIVTGASRGIGKALANECAKKSRNLILVSLPDEGLPGLARNLANTHGIQTAYYETDLTSNGSVDDFYDWCQDKGFQIDMLVNNAGLGSQGKFELSSHGEFRKMMQLNMEIVASMCWRGISLLKKHEKSYILNVGSIGSFTPVPYKTIYSATKHFVLAFSDALHYELKDSPVFVGCLCPGPTLTSDEQEAKVEELGLKARFLTKRADEVAKYAINSILSGKRTIIPGVGNKIITSLSRMLPIKWRLNLAGSTFSGSSFNHSK